MVQRGQLIVWTAGNAETGMPTPSGGSLAPPLLHIKTNTGHALHWPRQAYIDSRNALVWRQASPHQTKAAKGKVGQPS
tara:strand:- start:112194 stop:112427 length:234 start_codon:yes stop_codon:yes gene_type:complete